MKTLSVIQREFTRLSPDLVHFRKLSRDCLNSQRGMWGRLMSLHGVDGCVELDDEPKDAIEIVVTESDANNQEDFSKAANTIAYDPFIHNFCIGRNESEETQIDITDVLDILTVPNAKDIITQDLTQDEIVNLARNFLTVQSAILWTINFSTLRQAEEMDREDELPPDFGEALDERYGGDANVAVLKSGSGDEDDELMAKLEEYKSALLALHLCNQISNILLSYVDL